MSETSSIESDKFTISYSIWTAALFLLFWYGNELDRIFNLYLLLVPILFLPAIIAVVAWIVSLIRNIIHRRWRRLASVAVAPFIASGLFVLLSWLDATPDTIRFAFRKNDYLNQVAQIPQTNEPRLKLFDWGSTGGAGVTNIIQTLVYDESDEIALPNTQRSESWGLRANKLCPGTAMCSILKIEGSIDAKKLGDHFYIITEAF